MTKTLPHYALRLRLDLQKTQNISNILKKACARSIFLHILYSRGILPCPPEELLLFISSEATPVHDTASNGQYSKKRKLQVIKTERVMRKNGQKVQSLLNDYDGVFTMLAHLDESVKAVLYTIGPSFTSPREQYLIRFVPPSEENTVQETLVHEHISKLEKEIARRTIRLFLSETTESSVNTDLNTGKKNVDVFELSRKLCSKSLSSRKMNVAFFLSDSACNRMFHHCTQSPTSLDGNPVLPSERLDYPGFQVRHNFEGEWVLYNK